MSPAKPEPTSQPTAGGDTPPPWWHYGHVWLIIAGPVAVILAGIATLVIAVRLPDPLVADDYYRRGVEINRTLTQDAAKTLLPAMQGRNHAATPASALPIARPAP